MEFPLFSAKNITLYLENKKILDSISFEIQPQENLALMGKNGSGKTVLLKTLIGIFQPQKGESILMGKNVYELTERERNQLFQKTGYVFQKSGLFDSLSIIENVLFGLKYSAVSGPDEKLKIARECLLKTGLEGVDQKKPSELSGGMQKRASIARAVASEPDFLFLDDPTAGLDPVLTDSIGNLLLELKERLHSTSLIVTHDLELAYKLANRIGLVVEGRLHGILSVEEFRKTDEPHFAQFREGKLEGPISIL